jgi:hypothetical protein
MSYTTSKAQAGRGSIVSIGATPTVIGEVTDFPLQRGKWDFADVTNLQSGSDSEMLATMRKAASFTMKGNRVAADAGQVLVETAYQAGSLQTFSVELPKISTQTTKGDAYNFSAYVAGSSFSVSPTKQIEFSIDLQVSGPVTLVAGT